MFNVLRNILLICVILKRERKERERVKEKKKTISYYNIVYNIENHA